MSAVFDRPSLWNRARPIWTGFDVPARAGCRAARRRRPDDDVFGGLRPRQPLPGPRPQHAAGAAGALRHRPGAAAAAHEARDSPLRGRPAAVAGDGAARPGHHQEGSDALAQHRHHDPAERDHEDRHAAHAGVVVPAPRGPAARARLRHRHAAAARAGGVHRQATRPGHGDPRALGRPVRHLLRRPVVEAHPAGDAARRGGHHRRHRLRGKDLPARRQMAAAARLPEEPRLHVARPDDPTRSARAFTSSRARSPSARAAPPARAS